MAVAIAMHATHCASHQALQNLTPGSLTFCNDMVFNLPFLTDSIALQNTHQHIINQHLLHENANHISHYCKANDSILKKAVLHCLTN